VSEDLQALSDEEIFRRLYGAVQEIPSIREGDPELHRRAWDPVYRYADEMRRRYPPRTVPSRS
jgi:hypothetical protein